MQRGKFDRDKLRGLPRKYKEPLLALMTAMERTTNSVGFTPIDTIDSALGTAFVVDFSELWSDIDQLKATEGNTDKGGNSSTTRYMRIPIRPELPRYPRQGQTVSLTSCQTYMYKNGSWQQFTMTGDVGSTPPHNLLSTTHPDTQAYTPPQKGELIVGNDASKWQAMTAAAEDGYVLTADAAETRGVKWAAMAGEVLGQCFVNTLETTTSLTFVALTTPDEITIVLTETTSLLLEFFSTGQITGGAPQTLFSAFFQDGTQVPAAGSNIQSYVSAVNQYQVQCGGILISALAAGTYVFQVRHAVSGNTGGWQQRLFKVSRAS